MFRSSLVLIFRVNVIKSSGVTISRLLWKEVQVSIYLVNYGKSSAIHLFRLLRYL